MKGLYTVLLLICSNVFMTFAWYGHLKLGEYKWFQSLPVIAVIDSEGTDKYMTATDTWKE